MCMGMRTVCVGLGLLSEVQSKQWVRMTKRRGGRDAELTPTLILLFFSSPSFFLTALSLCLSSSLSPQWRTCVYVSHLWLPLYWVGWETNGSHSFIYITSISLHAILILRMLMHSTWLLTSIFYRVLHSHVLNILNHSLVLLSNYSYSSAFFKVSK